MGMVELGNVQMNDYASDLAFCKEASLSDSS
jgi:hypothetical protein